MSVVINVYDEDPAYVLEAVASVKSQSHSPHEIIAIDDGGPRDYATVWDRHPDVRVIRQPNQGLASARNAGLSTASGVFILFLDGDDRLLPHAIATMLPEFGRLPELVMVYGAWRFINETGEPSPRTVMPTLGIDRYATLLRGNCVGMHAAVLYRRDALNDVGGFDASFRVCEDYELYLRLARQGRIHAVPEMVAEYRQHGANVSADHARMLDGVLGVLASQEPYLHTRRDWRRARDLGKAGWKAYYAEQFLAMARHSVSERPMAMLQVWVRLWLRMPGTLIGATMRRASMGIRNWFTRGRVSFGDLRRTDPISTQFGFDRGRPIDRYYIESFLRAHAQDVHGRTLEVGDSTYTSQFGGGRVTSAEVLHVSDGAHGATYCTDLTEGTGLPDHHFDCIILTQTLHLVFDIDAALGTLRRILKPGGCLLLTVPGVSSVDRGEWGGTWFWSFTPAALDRALAARFGAGAATVGVHGNVLSATAFLFGLADHELSRQELDASDPHYPVIVTARVRMHVDARA